MASPLLMAVAPLKSVVIATTVLREGDIVQIGGLTPRRCCPCVSSRL